MLRLTIKIIGYLTGFMFLGVSWALASAAQPLSAPAVTDITVPEGRDFATRELHLPWDMDVFSDVSKGINHAESEDYTNYITNITVEDGVFSGVASGIYSEFYVLHPGTENGLYLPGTGVLTPIDSSRYSCIYVAMKVDISESEKYYWNVGWVEDNTLDWGGGRSGKTYGNAIANNQWVLYQMDLNTHPYISGDAWSSLPYWQGFRITPILQRAGTSFHVDWVRLTDCAPVDVSLSGLSAGQTYDIFLGHGSTEERQILVASGVAADDSGNLSLDVQGVEADTYTYYVKQNNTTVQQGTLTIEPAPIPTFTSPSPFSGADYSTTWGNPWDMSSSDDIVAVYCASWNVKDGSFDVDTLPASQLPPECVGSGAHEADPRVYLNTPAAVDISSYRYLSFKHSINGDWPRPEDGMIVRWMWRVPHPTQPGKFCVYVSRSVALDVGLHTYWVDLYNPRNTIPEETSGNASGCPVNVAWKNQHSPIQYFRMDPNENITSFTFHQQFDWIKLTKVPEVYQGVPFPIQVSLSKDPALLRSATFYYTTDLNDPTQHPVQIASTAAEPADSPPAPAGGDAAFQVYLPLVTNRYATPVVPPAVENEILIYWDTSSVPSGEYYICLASDDGYNQTTICSDAPVKVIPW